ncbi:MAG: signal recognition particle protein Srp54 [Phycisphaeraceae bacterium]|nr:signal recognition particle protein [Phycisphaerae bacterium]MBX3391421.1 signal recognition particle protein Srp54 [Phycisphaeraceae bacterium]HRJ49396.1 signal recognition particle protein [Phycisphaerales bacterium]
MFERLSEGFTNVFRKLSGQDKISEANVTEAMADVRTALLDADVHLSVADSFCEKVLQDAVGRRVTQSLKPGQEMIGIVHRRLVELLGGEVEATRSSMDLVDPATGLPVPAALGMGRDLAESGIPRISPGPTIVMMCGLQGSGKTTTCGKVAAYLRKRGRSVMLAAADLQRPAAVEQLETVARHADTGSSGSSPVTFYGEPDKIAAYGQAVGVAVDVCARAVEAARARGVDTVILDTAGRLHVNDALMDELRAINAKVRPHRVLLVVDAMTGQDAVNSARAFHEALGIHGVVLTKFDSDTRGGAALSVKHVTGAPITFVGVGEKIDALEEFHAERMAGRILGMGDVVSLVEKAQEQVSQQEAEDLQKKLEKGELTMDDFLSQMKAIRRMGPLKQLLGLLPGVGPMLKEADIDDRQMDRVEAMIHSMTPAERRKPEVIDLSRRRRVATGSGTTQDDVGRLVKQFSAVSKVTRQMAGLTGREKAAAVQAMQAGVGVPGFTARKSTASPSIKDRFKKRKR